MLFQTPEQAVRELALFIAECLSIPLRTIHIVDRDEGRLATHRQADVIQRQLLINF